MPNAWERLNMMRGALALLLALCACGGDRKSEEPSDGDEASSPADGADDDDDADDDGKSDDDPQTEPPNKKDAGSSAERDAGKAEGTARPAATASVGKGDGGTSTSAPARDASSPAPLGPPPAASGPADGDPGAPVVAIPEVKCGGAGGLDGLVGANFGGLPVPGTPNVQIGGRDVVVTYPCNKREGAHLTFILNLHGTMPDESLKLYQHSYFSAHKLAASHNLIVVSPKSVVSQWGNGDGGKDLPHLYEVIDWVYQKFSKFNIVGLWVGGHSWGSAYAKSFVCDEKLKERARGVVGMSGGASGVGGIGGLLGGGGGGSAGCADRLSQIHTVGSAEGGESGVPDQTAAATKHGCGARLAPKDIGKGQMLYDWPECDPGWTHFNFVMGDHDHLTPINDEVVKYIVEQIKATEMR